MLRILSWRIAFDVVNLLVAFAKLCRLPGGSVYYFAFGANLQNEVLLRRKMRVHSSRSYGLNGYKLSFSHPSAWEGVGFATAVESTRPGEKLYGKLYELSFWDGLRMDFYEGVYFAKRYKRTWFEHPETGPFFFYRSRKGKTNESLIPRAYYLKYIVDAYEKDESVPRELVRELRETPTIEEEDLQFASNGVFFDLSNSPRLLLPMARIYDRLLGTLFVKLYYLSFTGWLLPKGKVED